MVSRELYVSLGLSLACRLNATADYVDNAGQKKLVAHALVITHEYCEAPMSDDSISQKKTSFRAFKGSEGTSWRTGSALCDHTGLHDNEMSRSASV